MPETPNKSNNFAVIRASSGDLSDARLVWADRDFFTKFDRAGVGAPVFPDGVPSDIRTAIGGLAVGAEIRIGTALFGSPLHAPANIVALGDGTFAIALSGQADADPEAEDARLAEILDALPVAVTVVDPVDGTILWMNEYFRDLVGGSEFDLMGTSLAGHFALPGAFKTLMGATGPITPSASLPTALRTLSGMMTPVIANAKRIAFRRRRAAMVALTRGL
ncbi:MAG: PAS domain-containing protein [Alphaproteobacteria bacterium]|nr:PAS domain-containing protein [Alphaproteobacteria bacterium]